ncbi:MAG TPA: nuclear transport factor 2 family protein [Xanthomonadales bacterium]|nr:nuclear transport factor 2 family protein [Xanthomonadales bacterium]
MQHETDVLAVGERFIVALNAADEAAVRTIYAPDARIWHNFDQRVQTVDQNIESMHYVHSRLRNLNYDVKSRIAIPGGFVQQHVLRGVLPSGEEFAMPACAICRVENGRITSLEEYLDTAQARPLFT